MIAQARAECGALPNLEFVQDDINLHPYQPADLTVSFCTIQFVPPYLRQALFDRLYQSLNWGGALLIYEKVRAFRCALSGLHDVRLHRFQAGSRLLPQRDHRQGAQPEARAGAIFNAGLSRPLGVQDSSTS